MKRRDLVTAVTASKPLQATAFSISRRNLRILAFHGVRDQDDFGRQLHQIRQVASVVTADDVRRLTTEGTRLPPRAVWITFDDGDQSVIDNALPVLSEQQVEATMFVCPGLIQGASEFWWAVAEAAAEAGWSGGSSGVSPMGLKAVPDALRRELVDDATQFVNRQVARSIDESGLDKWLEAGMTVGNHTWDHPCLDQCIPEEQERQIVQAHEWLAAKCGSEPRFFAYPNGDWTEAAESALVDCGYEIGCLFDHRLAKIRQNPLRLSRLSLQAGETPARTGAILSGAHSLVATLGRSSMMRSK